MQIIGLGYRILSNATLCRMIWNQVDIISLMNIDTAQCRSGLCANVKYFFTRLRSCYRMGAYIFGKNIFFSNVLGDNIFGGPSLARLTAQPSHATMQHPTPLLTHSSVIEVKCDGERPTDGAIFVPYIVLERWNRLTTCYT